MARMRLVLSAIATAALVVVCVAGLVEDEKIDPLLDDREVEAFHSRATDQLERLAELMRRGETVPAGAGILAGDARSTALRPSHPNRYEVAGQVRVRRLEAPVSEPRLQRAETAIAKLVRSFPRKGRPRFEFEIVGVSPGEQSPWSTTVRYEGAGVSPRGVLQQTASWRVEWVPDEKDAPPLILSIRLEAFEEIRRPAFAFADSTGSVLPAGAAWIRHLQWGGEYWHGRVDPAGQPNLLGHHGIAIGDVNGDGLEDVYVALGSGLPNKLLIQNPDGTVRDGALEAGVAWLDDTKGAIFADMDNDGDQDLLLALGSTVLLCRNDGQGKFERFVRMRAPTPAPFYSLSVADYDLDGDLDIYGCRYVEARYGVSVPMPFHDADNGPPNHLLRNDGPESFTEVTEEVGLGVHNTRFSLIGVWADYDDDGDPDLYVANDFGRNNLYRNDGGAFVDVAADAGVEDQAAAMGVSWADFDQDGDLDLHVTNRFSAAGIRVQHAGGNSLFSNQGDGSFRPVSDVAGISMGRWGWGAKFVDLNNDGYEDIVAPNGFLTGALEHDLGSFFWRQVASRSPTDSAPAPESDPYLAGWKSVSRMMLEGASWGGRERNICYLNLGDGRFADVSYASGLDFLDDGRAVAVVDWDEDGDLDLWLKNRSGPQLRFLRNDGSGSEHFLALRLEGSTGNRDAIGARVDVLAGGARLRREVTAGDGYLSQSSKWLHFGLGEADTVDRLVIRWPGGETEEIGGPAVDRRYRVRQGAGSVQERPARAVRLEAEPAASPTPDRSARVLLKEPLVLPPTLRNLIYDGGAPDRATLVKLWAHRCSPCLVELAEIAGRYPDLHASGLDVVALSMVPPEDREQAQKIFETKIASQMSGPAFRNRQAGGDLIEIVRVVLEYVLQQPGELSLPTSLLVDPHGSLQMIYLGPLNIAGLAEDLERWARTPVPGATRSLYPGRWYFRTPRNLLGLATALKERDLREDARFYLGLAHINQRRSPASN